MKKAAPSRAERPGVRRSSGAFERPPASEKLQRAGALQDAGASAGYEQLEWITKKLSYIVLLQSGEMISSNDVSESGTYPVFGGGGFRGYTAAFTHTGKHALIGRQGALCGNVCYAEGPLWATEHSIVATPKEQIEMRWLVYLLHSMNLGQYSTSAAQPGIAAEVIGALRVPVPPLPTQRSIAGYLDRETKRLDELVRAKVGLLELVAEKRRALITRAVTRGLNPKSPLRDSGIPWLGMIPAHWEVKRLKHITAKMEQGWSPQCDSMPAGDDEWGVLKAGCVNGPVLNENENKRLPDTEKPIPELEIQPGDILMSRANTTELLGSCVFVEAVRPKLILCDKLYRFHADASVASGHFLVHFLSSPPGRFVMERDASGASNSMQNIGQEIVKNLFVPVPPLTEQRAIVAHIATETAKLDALRSSAERTIRLLKERRSALISAAVTGKIAISAPAA